VGEHEAHSGQAVDGPRGEADDDEGQELLHDARSLSQAVTTASKRSERASRRCVRKEMWRAAPPPATTSPAAARLTNPIWPESAARPLLPAPPPARRTSPVTPSPAAGTPPVLEPAGPRP